MTNEEFEAMKNSLLEIKGHTRWNSIRMYTAGQLEPLILHIDKCHELIDQLTQINDYEFPYRIPELIDRAAALRKSVA